MKTRNISILEYFHQLQIEYLKADFMRAIHHSPKQKKFWKRVMSHKRTKIESVSIRVGMPSIFDEDLAMKEYRALVFPDAKHIGLKFELEPEELELYYSVGENFKVQVAEDKFALGQLVSVDLAKNLASMRIRGKSQPSTHTLSKIFRVF